MLPLPRFRSRIANGLAFLVTASVAAGTLYLSVTVALDARAHQLSGLPMPNGKGGLMSFRGGYESAVFFLVIGLAWLLGAGGFLWRAVTGRLPKAAGDTVDAA